MDKKRLDAISESFMLFMPFFFGNLLRAKWCEQPHHIGPRIKVLFMLSKAKPAPISEIGRRLCISKPNMTTLIDGLIKEGLAGRAHDKKDRRIINIETTKKGLREAEREASRIKEIIATNLSKLGERDLEELEAAIEKTKGILSKLEGESNAA
ncbi:MarR family protein [uncultured archaeon]|nr:MarR family protein [uncultured archaeon]